MISFNTDNMIRKMFVNTNSILVHVDETREARWNRALAQAILRGQDLVAWARALFHRTFRICDNDSLFDETERELVCTRIFHRDTSQIRNVSRKVLLCLKVFLLTRAMLEPAAAYKYSKLFRAFFLALKAFFEI